MKDERSLEQRCEDAEEAARDFAAALRRILTMLSTTATQTVARRALDLHPRYKRG